MVVAAGIVRALVEAVGRHAPSVRAACLADSLASITKHKMTNKLMTGASTFSFSVFENWPNKTSTGYFLFLHLSLSTKQSSQHSQHGQLQHGRQACERQEDPDSCILERLAGRDHPAQPQAEA